MKYKLLAFALVMVAPHTSAETITSLSAGFDFTSGKYGGTSATDILYIPVTGKVQFEKSYLKLTVPYISVSSTDTQVVRGRGIVKSTSKTTTTTTTESGLGDVVASAGYTVYETDDVALNLVGNIKFATADSDKLLGSGKNDYSAQIDGFYSLKTSSLFATAGYKIFGAPAGAPVNNIVYSTFGLSHKTGDKSTVGFALDAAQSSSELSPGTREFSIFISNKISKTEKIQANLTKGFSDSSPDYGFGLTVARTF